MAKQNRPAVGYKFLTDDLTSMNNGDTPGPHSSFPKWKVGEVRKISDQENLRMCSTGFHSSNSAAQARGYCHSNVLTQVTRLGRSIHGRDKVVSEGIKIDAMTWVGDLFSNREQQFIGVRATIRLLGEKGKFASPLEKNQFYGEAAQAVEDMLQNEISVRIRQEPTYAVGVLAAIKKDLGFQIETIDRVIDAINNPAADADNAQAVAQLAAKLELAKEKKRARDRAYRANKKAQKIVAGTVRSQLSNRGY